MKKKLTGFALLSSLFLLTACNATNTDISGSGDSTSKSEQVSGDSSETEEVSSTLRSWTSIVPLL